MVDPEQEQPRPRDPELALVERLVEALGDVGQWYRGLSRNETWSEIESLLAALGAGDNVGEVLVPIREDPEGAGGWGWLWMLRFGRLKDEWGLCYGAGPVDSAAEYWEHPWRWKPIAECTVDERKEVALALPRLLQAMADQAERSEISDALATLKQALANLRRVVEKRAHGSANGSTAP